MRQKWILLSRFRDRNQLKRQMSHRHAITTFGKIKGVLIKLVVDCGHPNGDGFFMDEFFLR